MLPPGRPDVGSRVSAGGGATRVNGAGAEMLISPPQSWQASTVYAPGGRSSGTTNLTANTPESSVEVSATGGIWLSRSVSSKYTSTVVSPGQSVPVTAMVSPAPPEAGSRTIEGDCAAAG